MGILFISQLNILFIYLIDILFIKWAGDQFLGLCELVQKFQFI